MRQETAETLALRALGWIASQDELAGTFLSASGSTPDDLRARAADPVFLGAVLDFLLLDDQWIIAFCTETGLKFTDPQMARAVLPGGAQTNWT